MKKRFVFALGLLVYIILLGLLLHFDLRRMLQPLPLVSVLAGIVILTLFQYKRGMTWVKLLLCARWNAFVAGLLTSLLSLLMLFSGGTVSMRAMAEKLIPLIYGSLVWLVLDLLMIPRDKGADRKPEQAPQDVFSAQTAHPVFAARGLSARECHVALKLLEGITNKEIAAQLYISEATVKKHIQNMFKKCSAKDRQDLWQYTSAGLRNRTMRKIHVKEIHKGKRDANK